MLLKPTTQIQTAKHHASPLQSFRSPAKYLLAESVKYLLAGSVKYLLAESAKYLLAGSAKYLLAGSANQFDTIKNIFRWFILSSGSFWLADVLS